jgi:hypothetical protein
VRACWKRCCLGAVAALITLGTAVGAAAGPMAPAPQPAPLLEAVARHLGLPPARLEAAVRAAELERWNAFASAHHIPEERVREVQEEIARQPVTLVARFGSRGKGVLAAAAAYLGLQPAELVAQLRQGKSLADVAAAAGKSTDGLKSAIYAAAQAELAGRVQAGTMTAEARQKALDELRVNLDAMIRQKLPPGPGGVRKLQAAG